jgi:ABC-type transport system involved in multi-copper enzyme maturation permease subunit
MTTATAAPNRSDRMEPGTRAAYSSELLKLRSIVSVGVMLAVAVVLTAAISLYNSDNQSVVGQTYIPAGQGGIGGTGQTIFPAHVNPTGTALSGYILGAALFAAFGAIAGALEYSSGLIRISLIATPNRSRFFLCKAAAVATTAMAAAAACTLACFLIGEYFFRGQAEDSIGLTSPGVPLHLAGAVVCLVGWAMIGFAFGMLLRSSALGVTVSLALYIAGPLVAEYIDPDRANNVTPTQAGQALWIYRNPLNPDIAPFGLGLAVFLVYVAVFLAAAFARIRLADA